MKKSHLRKMKDKKLKKKQKKCLHSFTTVGYGFAGGDIGAYVYCEDCSKILNKTRDPECM